MSQYAIRTKKGKSEKEPFTTQLELDGKGILFSKKFHNATNAKDLIAKFVQYIRSGGQPEFIDETE